MFKNQTYVMEKDKNYLNQMILYIKRNLKKGYTKESLKWALVNQGHSRLEIEKAFKIAEKEFSTEAPILTARPKITYEKLPLENSENKPASNKKSFWRKLFG